MAMIAKITMTIQIITLTINIVNLLTPLSKLVCMRMVASLRESSPNCVAIPVFMAYNYLVSRVNGIILEMEKASTELVNSLSE